MLYVWVEETIRIFVSTRIYGCIRRREFITAAIAEVDAFGSRIARFLSKSYITESGKYASFIFPSIQMNPN